MKIFITGASSGIGFATAIRYAQAGHELVLLGKTEEHVKSAEMRLRAAVPGVQCTFKIVDFFVSEDRERLYRALEQEMFDVFIHSAGFFLEGTLLDQDQEAFAKMEFLHVQTLMELNQRLFSRLRQPGGRIIIVGSTAGLEVYAARGRVSVGQAYSVTKWAVRGYALNLREEAKASGVGVTLISPGSVFTEMWEGTDVPTDRFCTPQDVAELIYTTTSISSCSVVEEVVIRPLQGNV
jgi:short-subunit dehydrogenase